MKRYQASESLPVGLLLALAGGILDSYTYLNRGQVFATAETGNLVLLGIALAQGAFHRALYYLLPITAFALGVLVAEALRRHLRTIQKRFHWRQAVLLAECSILVLVSLLPLGGVYDPLSNILISFTSAMQIDSFRKFCGCPCATTMCTGNLRSGTENLFHRIAEHDSGASRKVFFYYGLILCFVTGAVSCGLLSPVFHGRTVLFAIIPQLIAFSLMFRADQCESEV